MPFPKALTFLSSLLLLGLTSCSPQVSQCNQLITAINEAQVFDAEYEQAIKAALAQLNSAQNMSELQSGAGVYIATMQKASTQSDLLAQSLAALELEDEQLREYREGYMTAANQWSRTFTDAKEAMQLLADAENEDAFRSVFGRFEAQVNGAFSALQTIDAEAAQITEGVNTYCEPAAQ